MHAHTNTLTCAQQINAFLYSTHFDASIVEDASGVSWVYFTNPTPLEDIYRQSVCALSRMRSYDSTVSRIPVSSACAREMKWNLMLKSNIFLATLRPRVWGIPKMQLSPSRIHTVSPPPPPRASLGIREGKSLRPLIVEASSGSGLCFQHFSIHKILFGLRVHDCVQLHTRVLFLFLLIFVPNQRLLHSSPAVPLPGPADSQLCAHAEVKPGIRVGKCNFQGVVKRPEESEAAQQQQKLKDRAKEREESSKLTTSAVWNSQMGVRVQRLEDKWQRWSQQQKKKIMTTTMVR